MISQYENNPRWCVYLLNGCLFVTLYESHNMLSHLSYLDHVLFLTETERKKDCCTVIDDPLNPSDHLRVFIYFMLSGTQYMRTKPHFPTKVAWKRVRLATTKASYDTSQSSKEVLPQFFNNPIEWDTSQQSYFAYGSLNFSGVAPIHTKC